MEKHRILIVEDDEGAGSQMLWALSPEYEARVARDPGSAMEALRGERAPVVVLDLGLPPRPRETTEGLKLLGWILQHDPLAKVVVVTGTTERECAMRAIAHGAHDFLTKPVEPEELKIILRRAIYVRSLETEHRRRSSAENGPGLSGILGVSQKMQEVFATVRKVASSDVPVLISGESGTGKELVANAIHAGSGRKGRPFVPINCGAIPETLLETELFGHEKGSFTGAYAQRCGRIEAAQGGTLFLDEIAELPLQLQVKVLRFLQDRRLERVGGREPIPVDTRIVAAANRCVKKLSAEGRFREDLYYRIAVVTIELPPLRERGEDVVLLARAFLQRYTPEGTGTKTLAPEAVEAMTAYAWPGNVRELENRVRRAITFSEGPVVRPSDLGFGPADEGAEKLDLKKAKEDLEVRFVQLAILKHNGNISKAAEELGLSRPTVHHIIKKYNMLEAVRKG